MLTPSQQVVLPPQTPSVSSHGPAVTAPPLALQAFPALPVIAITLHDTVFSALLLPYVVPN
jgi:hypothetical protein